nr:elongation factor G [Gammaproteobacteria bacterium]
MPDYKTEDIRNIAFVGHAASGKTTLIEALLYQAGTIPSKGEIAKGSTVCDFDPLEKEFQHSLRASLASTVFRGRHINMVDTPGYPDFLCHAFSVLPAVETAAVVIDARAGIEMSTRRILEAAARRRQCRLIIINKIDAEDADLSELLGRIEEDFGRECLPLNLPAQGGKSVVDCFFEPSSNATDISSAAEAHTRIVEQVVEIDEELMELYLEQGEEMSAGQLHDAFEKALREGHLIPICFVSAHTGAGVPELLEVLARLMPNPKEGNPPLFFSHQGDRVESVEIVPEAERHALAHVFNVLIDPFVGRLAAFRVHQGVVTKDSQLFINDARKPFKVGHLLQLQGKDHVEIDAGIPGDLCAVAKIDDIQLDAVLHDSHDEDTISLQPIELPEPMFGLAIRAKTRGDEQKLSDTLQKLSAEDPCFRIEHNATTNETVVRGLGELHMRIMLERMKSRYNVEVETQPPKIAYRETITMNAEGHHRHKKQTGGAGQFGEVFLRVEPLTRGAGFEFVDSIVGGVIPGQFIPAVEKGVRQVLASGAIAGYPIADVKVILYDGKHHPVDSKEVAFVAAGKKAFLDAVSKAKPIVLEPIVDIQITVPQENMGDIASDLSSKRGRINGTESLPAGMVMVSGQAPLGELDNYASQLKAVTGGAGSYTIAFSHYD